MRGKRALLLVGALVLVVGSTGFSEASEDPQSQRTSLIEDVVARVMRAGAAPNEVVVQDGHRNYAGPDCPGSAWNCTTAPFVVQITAGGTNESECTSAEDEEEGANPCVIVQVSDEGTNLARCVQETSQGLDSSQVSKQVCDIKQTNTSGKNSAVVKQVAAQETDNEKQVAVQYARVKQTNESGSNEVQGYQAVSQKAASAPSGKQVQIDRQTFSLNQSAASGTNDQAWRQSLDQNAEMHSDAYASTEGGGAESSVQVQNAVLDGRVHQDSDNVSRGTNSQSGTQTMSAPDTTVQVQDPRIRCCAEQSGGSKDVFEIDQEFVQLASNPKKQFAADVGRCKTSGTCTITQRARQNDAKKHNFVSGTGLVTASIVCRGKGGDNKCVATSSVKGKGRPTI